MVDPDGSDAAEVEIAFSDAVWWPQAVGEPPRRRRDLRTDAHGQFIRDAVTECAWPTLVYAWDIDRQLAGMALVERADDLARPISVRLERACWVRGTLVSAEASRLGFSPKSFSAMLTPLHRARPAARGLRFIRYDPGEFKFLVPARAYVLDVQGSRLEWRQNIPVRVPPNADSHELGVMDLEASGLARLEGKPAPEWDVEQWSDGATRTVRSYLGSPLLLCFWQKNSGRHSSLPQIFETYRQVQASGGAVVLIHPPEEGGLAAVQEFLNSAQQIDPAPDIAMEMKKWPFIVGMDRFAGTSPPLGAVGLSQESYGVLGYPCFILIDTEGRIVADSTMPHDRWRDALQALAGRDP